LSNPIADFNMGFAYLQGRGVARDLALSREHFRKAADAGHLQAQRILIALLANGTTGGRDWQAAMQRLHGLKSSGDAQAARQIELLGLMDLDAEGDPRRAFEVDRLSDRPEVTLFADLFTEAERHYLMDAALPAYQPATVGHVAGGHARQIVQQVRTCDVAAFPWIAEDPVIHALNRRIAAAAGVAVETGEPLQILRYRPGQEFKPHRDSTEDTENQRVLTMLVYLNDAYTGGETLFLSNDLKVRGKAGDGLLFRNADTNGVGDPDSLHAGLPVESGEKVVASRWIRQRRFGPTA
jgi:prolyl 4-hydroxylase